MNEEEKKALDEMVANVILDTESKPVEIKEQEPVEKKMEELAKNPTE